MVERTGLFFKSQSCAACKKMYPFVDQLQKEGFKIETVDTDKSPDTAKKYTVTSLPVFVILLDGGCECHNKEIKRFTGVTDIELLRTGLKMPDYKIW